MSEAESSSLIIPDPAIAIMVQKHPKTIKRWDKDERMKALGWPDRIDINGRGHRDRAAFERFMRNVAVAGIKAATA